MWAPVIQVFCPLITNSPFDCAARHDRLPTSDPASGSDMAIAPVRPSTIPPRISSLSASLPNSSTGRPDIIVTGRKPIGIIPRANSSHSRDSSTAPPPDPPYASGTAAPSQPRDAICAYTSGLCGSSPPWVSASRCSRVPHSRRAKSRIASTNARCSSDRFWIGIACRDYSPGMLIRDADAERDAGACAALYAPYVRDTPISLEERVPTTQELADRIETTTRTHPWLVAHDGGALLGYAYATRHRE